jgi:hypothetical protein
MKKPKFIALVKYIYCLTMTAGSMQITLSAPTPQAARRTIGRMMMSLDCDIVKAKIVKL